MFNLKRIKEVLSQGILHTQELDWKVRTRRKELEIKGMLVPSLPDMATHLLQFTQSLPDITFISRLEVARRFLSFAGPPVAVKIKEKIRKA